MGPVTEIFQTVECLDQQREKVRLTFGTKLQQAAFGLRMTVLQPEPDPARQRLIFKAQQTALASQQIKPIAIVWCLPLSFDAQLQQACTTDTGLSELHQ